MKKYLLDFEIIENKKLSPNYSVLIIKPKQASLPDINPGQFVEIEIPNSKSTFLRRPISVNFVDKEKDLLWLLVRKAGNGTSSLLGMQEGESLNLLLPLGNGFSIYPGEDMLLIGGGVGVAPLLYLGKIAKEKGANVKFLLGARSKNDLLELDKFEKIGEVYISTENGDFGEKGFVTQNSVLNEVKNCHISCCGPMPMMKAVANIAKEKQLDCEVSLENTMACGLGACLCCVEDTVDGNVCVCKEGPVFNIKKLKW